MIRHSSLAWNYNSVQISFLWSSVSNWSTGTESSCVDAPLSIHASQDQHQLKTSIPTNLWTKSKRATDREGSPRMIQSDLCSTVTRKVIVLKLRAFSQALVHRVQICFFFFFSPNWSQADYKTGFGTSPASATVKWHTTSQYTYSTVQRGCWAISAAMDTSPGGRLLQTSEEELRALQHWNFNHWIARN